MKNPINIYGLWTWNFWDCFHVSVRFELTSIYKYFKYSNDTQVILDFPSRDFHDLSRIITISSDLTRLSRIFMKFQTSRKFLSSEEIRIFKTLLSRDKKWIWSQTHFFLTDYSRMQFSDLKIFFNYCIRIKITILGISRTPTFFLRK